MSEWRTDFELLRAFVREGQQQAFADVVRRHLDLVYAAALRKVTDASAAEEITQNVLTALGRKAWQFAPDDCLPAWLHRTTLLESKNWLRGELRRQRREEAAAELGTTMKTSDEPGLTVLVPLLDEALLSLREQDRAALLLRYHEQRSLRDVGASLGTTEDTARKRVQSALEKLADFFKRRGFKTATVAATTAALQHTAVSASATTANAVMTAALQSTPPTLVGLLASVVGLTKMQKSLLCVCLLAIPLLWFWVGSRAPSNEINETTVSRELVSQTLAKPRQLQAVAANANLPPPDIAPDKEYSVHLRGIVRLADFKGALIAIQHHSLDRSNTPPFIIKRMLAEGETFYDRSIKDAYAHFELLRVEADSWKISLGENGEARSYQLEDSARSRLAPDTLGLNFFNTDIEDVVDVYARLLGRTVICHPGFFRQSPSIELAEGAQDRAEAAAVLENVLREKARAATYFDGERFALLGPTNLLASLPTSLMTAASPVTTNYDVPPHAIYFLNASIGHVLQLHGALSGRTLAPEAVTPPLGQFTFRNQTALSKADVVHAFDVLLAWQGLQVVFVGDKDFKVVPLSKTEPAH